MDLTADTDIQTPVDEETLAQGWRRSPLRVVSLNLGCRNTNPLEFELKGDGSETAAEATALLCRANKSLGSIEEGPRSMPEAEMQLVRNILEEIYSEGSSEEHAQVQALFQHETWEELLTFIRTDEPHFFNALNLLSLELNRPSVWENSSARFQFNTTIEYLAAWKQWYGRLDRCGSFWLNDAPGAALKRGMDRATAFAGLLVFDVMSFCVMQTSLRNVYSGTGDVSVGRINDKDGREAPFEASAKFAAELPASRPGGRGEVAKRFVKGAHIILAQDAWEAAADLQGGTSTYLGPFLSLGGLSAVLLRRAAFKEATDISAEVAKRMEELSEHVAQQEQSRRAWRSTATRLAAVYGQCSQQVGGFKVCAMSLHCSKKVQTADFLTSLVDVLADYNADVHVVGVNANCSSEAVAVLQRKLRIAGLEIGCQPKQEQVTVAKTRTRFQTQVQNIGEVDISHKDYILSWVSAGTCRQETTYTPDLRSAFGVDQETKRCISLPTTSWPFDHCGVATSFTPRHNCREMVFSRRSLFSGALVTCMLALLLLPAASSERENPYGQPGTWHRDGFTGKPLTGICEGGPLPCAEGWIFNEGSCYKATRRMSYSDAQEACQMAGTELVSISSEAENQFVTSLCAEDEFCWIGLRTDHAGEDSWWVSGEPVEYNNVPETDAALFPLFPATRAFDYQVVVLSNLPGEIGRCGLQFHGPLVRVPLHFHLVSLYSSGVVMVVSGIFLLLPRPPHTLTTVYQTVAFGVNFCWFAGKTLDLCFTADLNMHRLAFTVHVLVDTAGHTASYLISAFIILRRMRCLYPCKTVQKSFRAVVVFLITILFTVLLFTDLSAGFNPFSVVVWAFFGQLFLAATASLVFAVLIISDLHQTWTFLRTEAATGLSTTGGSTLANEVRAARLHLLVVLAALTTGTTRFAFLWFFLFWYTQPGLTEETWCAFIFFLLVVVDSMTNDLCTYVLATVDMDGAVQRACGISAEVATRAQVELEQHRIAVLALKAAPTSPEQLSELAQLETEARSFSGKDREPFLALQSLVWAETARIHRMMECARLCAMTMPIRYQYLMEVPSLEAEPRQHVPTKFAGNASPEAASEYFEWLYEEAEGARKALLQQVKQLLARFNSTRWPTDLGLVREHFPWMIRASAFVDTSEEEGISPGDVLIHTPAKTTLGRILPRNCGTLCFVLQETSSSSVRVHRCGMDCAEDVPRKELRTCTGGGVLVPGPKKKRQRCLDKIARDYEGVVPWPAAASLTDMCRCQIVLDDPYDIAVLAEYIRLTMKVVRLKNRFSADVLESKSTEELQSTFADASDTSKTETKASIDSPTAYRDMSMNVEVSTPSGVPFVCEIQLTLATLAILKSADQKLYTIRRMRSASELGTSYVFSSAA